MPRRRFDVRIVPRIAVGTWWQESVYGLIEPVEFRLEEKLTGKSVARATAWEMEAFSCTWNQPAVGILDIHVRDDLRQQGLGKFLLAQLLRYLQDQYFGLCEVQAAEQLIDSMTGKLDLSTFRDEYREKLEEMIERRKHGKTMEVADEVEDREPTKTVNLMDALRRSLKSSASHDGRGNGRIIAPRKRIARTRRPHARKR